VATFLKVFAGLVGLFVIVGLSLSNEINIERSVSINAPVDVIHTNVSDLTKWSLWSPWIRQDPSIKTTLGEIKKGVGASQTWQGASGSGQLKFTQSSLEQGVVYDISFEGDSTVYQSGFTYQMSKNSDEIIVTWFMKGEMSPIVIGNYFALVMDSLIGDSFKQGLNDLKSVSEQN